MANALNQLGHLNRFFTSGYVTWPLLQNWAAKRPSRLLNKRFHRQLDTQKVSSHWRYEIKEQLFYRIYGAGDKVQRAVFNRDKSFDRLISKKLPKYQFDTFWGFQGSCLKSIKCANSLDKLSICELTTAHVTAAQKILLDEQKLHPNWADSFDNLNFPLDYQRRLEEEPYEAKMVLAASQFTKQTLLDAGIKSNKIQVLPLGFDSTYITYRPDKIEPYKNRPLKLLYVGRITQRKGIAYLLEAMKHFRRDDVELDIIGYVHGEGKGLKSYKGLYKQLPSLGQHDLFSKYGEYDALVLPTIFEGFGLVIVEALMAGLPVITTSHSIGPDVINDHKNGYLVPIRDVQALVRSIEKLASKDEDQLLSMKKAAHNSAMSFTWDKYAQRLGLLIAELEL
ncbi:MAG: glycosyltransferase family 4 protein [Bacteroidota bacterium]